MRNLGSILATVAALLLAGGSVTAAAGHPHERQGWLFGLGAGGGRAEVITDAGGGEPRNGGSVTVHIDYAFHRQLSAGVGTSSWIRVHDGVRTSFSVLGAFLGFYPGAKGFVLRAGAGLGQVNLQSGPFSGILHGPAVAAGAGYEFRLGRRLALGPTVDVARTYQDGFQTNHVTGSLALTWYELKR